MSLFARSLHPRRQGRPRARRRLAWPVLLTGLLLVVMSTMPASAAGTRPNADKLRTIPPRAVPSRTHDLPAVALPTPGTLHRPIGPTRAAGERLLISGLFGDASADESEPTDATGAAVATDATDVTDSTDATTDTDAMDEAGSELQVAAVGATSCLPTVPSITQRILVISADGNEADMNDPSAPGKPGAIQTALDYLGVPYAVYVASTHTLTPSLQGSPLPAAAQPTAAGLTSSMLFTQTTDATSGCVASRGTYYSGIITATGALGLPNGTSALTNAEWQTLWSFASTFNIRQLSWFTFPNDLYGFQPFNTSGSAGYVGTLTAAGTRVFGYVNPTASIPIDNAFTYFARPLDASTTALVTDAAGNALVATRLNADGRETMAATFDSNQFLRHTQVLQFGMINWLTKGLFLGERHVYATPQEDDIFNLDSVWNTSATGDLPTTTPASPPVACTTAPDAATLPVFRINGADFNALTAWQRQKQANPQFANFRLAHAFNGWGTSADFYANDAPRLVPVPTAATDTLVTSVKANQADYEFISHTWGHANLNSVPAGWTTAVQGGLPADSNLAANDQLARGTLVGPFTHYQKSNLVTPDVSGLASPITMNEAFSFGIRTVVSDTSVVGPPSGANPSPNAGIRNAINPGILEVPRRPVNQYFNGSQPGEWLGQDNCLYPPTAAFATPARPAPAFGAVTSYAALLDRVSGDLLPYMLTGDMDPWMFHQPNLRAYDGTHSVYSDLMDALFAKYSALFTLPVRSETMETLAANFANRMAYNAAGATATLNGNTLTVSSPRPATIPATLPTGVAVAGAESYGGQQIAHTTVAANAQANLNVSVITVLPFDQTRAYGQPNPALTGVVTGVVDGDRITATYSTPATANSAPGIYPIVATLSDPDNRIGSGKYAVTNLVGTLTVTPAPLVVTVSQNPPAANGQVGTKVYGEAMPALSGVMTGALAGDQLTFNSITTKEPLSATSPAGTYPFNVILNDPLDKAKNYVIVTTPVAFTITPAPLVVRVNDTSRTYGQPNPTPTVSLTGLLPGQDATALGGTPAYATSATPASAVGSYPVSASGLTSTNYAISYVDGKLTVNPAPLTIAAADVTRTAGSGAPELSGTISGLVNGDAISATYTTNADAASAPGTYPIVPSVVDSVPSALGNYTLQLINGTLTVVPASVGATPAPVVAAPAPRAANGGGGGGGGGGSASSSSPASGGAGGFGASVGSSAGVAPIAAPAPSTTNSSPTPLAASETQAADTSAPAPQPTPAQPAIQSVSGVIDPLVGGSLDTPEGRVHFSMPMAATLDQVLVTVAPGALVSTDQGLVASTAIQPAPLFQMGTTRIDVTAVDSISLPVVGVAQQVNLTVEPDMADVLAVGGDASRLKLAYLDETAGAWVPLATSVVDGRRLSADSATLGHFGVLLQTGSLSVCLAQDTSLWSSPSAAADLFGLTPAGMAVQVLDQVGTRFLIQDSQANLAWIDVSAGLACGAPGTAEQTVNEQAAAVPQDDLTVGVPLVEEPIAEVAVPSVEEAVITVDESAVAPAETQADN